MAEKRITPTSTEMFLLIRAIDCYKEKSDAKTIMQLKQIEKKIRGYDKYA